MVHYSLVEQHDGAETLVVLLDGELRNVPSAHANFQRIKNCVKEDGATEARLRTLLDARAYVSAGLRRLSERVAFDGNSITFDGDVIDTALSTHLIRLLKEGSSAFRPVVLFMEHLAQNPSPLSRRHLWKWLEARDFSLTPEGHIIGYKAVLDTPDNRSITSGRNQVYVNGQVHIGQIPNPTGADVVIARSDVNANRDHGCAAGLHVGTWDYAVGFGGAAAKVLTVSVNPRDVVAVPRDCAYKKMRVCRYFVHAVTEAQHETALVAFGNDGYLHEEDFEDDDDEHYFG